MENLLSKLVAFKTTTDNRAANNKALDFIGTFLEERGLRTEIIDHEGYRSLIASTRNTKTPAVLLAAHLDVVSAPDDQFALRKHDGKLYGRGTLDMKFAIATYMQLVDELQENLNDYDFGIMITTDEESGGNYGVEKLVAAGYAPKVCVLPDGGDNWQMQLFAKGNLYLKISANGKSAHGSRPWLGQNAILTLMDIIGDIRALFPVLDVDTNTYNIGAIQGGAAPNQVAEFAQMHIDIRVISEEERTRLLEKIRLICERHHAKMVIELSGAVCIFDLSDPWLAPFAHLITEVTGIEVKGSRTLGNSDARFFAAKGVPCVSLYPTGAGHHGPEEWIDEKAFYQFKEVLQQYLSEMARKPQ